MHVHGVTQNSSAGRVFRPLSECARDEPSLFPKGPLILRVPLMKEGRQSGCIYTASMASGFKPSSSALFSTGEWMLFTGSLQEVSCTFKSESMRRYRRAALQPGTPLTHLSKRLIPNPKSAQAMHINRHRSQPCRVESHPIPVAQRAPTRSAALRRKQAEQTTFTRHNLAQ